MPKCCPQSNYCFCKKGTTGEKGEKGPTGPTGLRGPSNENFVFGLTTTDGLDADSDGRISYWLVPGGQISRKAIFDASRVGVPPSMAVGYNAADISACAINISTSGPDVSGIFKFKIYAFCRVNDNGDPSDGDHVGVSGEPLRVSTPFCQCLPLDRNLTGSCKKSAFAVKVVVLELQPAPRTINISLTLYSKSPLNVP